MRTILLAAVAAIALTGCATNPETGGRELTNSGKAAIAAFAGEFVDRYVSKSPDRDRTVRNISQVASRLQAVTDAVTVTELRSRLDAEIALLDLSELDRRSVDRWLPLMDGLLRDYVGREELDANGYLCVNEFLQIIVAALPPPVS